MPNTNKKFREELFKNITNFPENPTEDEIISRNIGGNMFYTTPGDTGRAMVIGGQMTDAERESSRKAFRERNIAETEDKRKAARGSIVIEEGRKKIDIDKAELARLEGDYEAQRKRGYSEQNLLNYKQGIERLRKDISDRETWLSGYDALQGKIKGYETAEQTTREEEIKRQQAIDIEKAKKPFGETPEGMITQGQIDIAIEQAKKEGKLSPTDEAEVEVLKGIVTNKDMPEEEVATAQKRLNEIFASYRQPTETAEPGEITGTILGQKATIRGNQATINGEPFMITPDKNLMPTTAKGLILSIAASTNRPDMKEIGDAILKEVGKGGTLTYEPVRNLYARALRNNDTEMASLFLEMLPYVSQVEPEEAPEGAMEDQINAIMKQYGLTKEQAINKYQHTQNLKAGAKQQVDTEKAKAEKNIKAKTGASDKFTKNSYGDILSLQLEDGTYLDRITVARALSGNFDSWVDKVKRQHNMTAEEEKLLKDWASDLSRNA